MPHIAARLWCDAAADRRRRTRQRLGEDGLFDVEHRPGVHEPAGQVSARSGRHLLRHLAGVLPGRVGGASWHGSAGERLRPCVLRSRDQALQLRTAADEARRVQGDVRAVAQVPADGFHRQLPAPFHWHGRLGGVREPVPEERRRGLVPESARPGSHQEARLLLPWRPEGVRLVHGASRPVSLGLLPDPDELRRLAACRGDDAGLESRCEGALRHAHGEEDSRCRHGALAGWPPRTLQLGVGPGAEAAQSVRDPRELGVPVLRFRRRRRAASVRACRRHGASRLSVMRSLSSLRGFSRLAWGRRG